jgi:hypothetical protein
VDGHGARRLALPCATDKYPFYPHLRFFRRDAFGDWEGAIARIRAALEEAVAQGDAGGNAA